MKRNSCLTILTLIATLMLSLASRADDIEIYLTGSAVPSNKANILFVIDNAASWTANLDGSVRKIDAIHEALYTVVNNPEFLGEYNVGFMSYAQGNSPKGGKIIAAVKELDATHRDWLNSMMYTMAVNGTAITATTHPLVPGTVDTSEAGLTKVLKSGGGTDVINNGAVTVTFADTTTHVLVTGDSIAFTPAIGKTNNAPMALTLNEAYRYFGGMTPASGIQDGALSSTDTFAADKYDPTAYNSSTGLYNSPSVGNVCGTNVIIFIATGEPDNGENRAAEPVLDALGGILSSDPINLSPDDFFEASWIDEFARHLNNNVDLQTDIDGKQNIITYAIHVYDAAEDTLPQKTKHKGAVAALTSMSKEQGGGGYFAAYNADEVAVAMEDIFNEVQAVNDVFASASLPVSVNVRGTHLNQVYIGVFRPNADLEPRWFGNLKMYQFGVGASGLELRDADNNQASNSTTGFINLTARSFWTHASTFWNFSPSGTPVSGNDNPDGEVVEKGAAAQQIRDIAPAARNLYTCTSCNANDVLSATPFNSTNVSTTDLGAVDSAERDNIIAWMKGTDLFDEDGDGDDTDMRASVHGDVLHSRPAVINYGTDDNDVYVFYGANDGVFRAIKGGKETDNPTGGNELWGFIMPEFNSQLKTLYTNAVMTDITDKPYFADGSISIYRNPNVTAIDKTGSGDVIIYITMRRGGRFIYALDVTNPNEPKIKWRKSSVDYPNLGYTWSVPKLAKVASTISSDPVLIMGLGYDPADDGVSPSGFTTGQGVIVLNAITGAVVKEFGTSYGFTHPVPSDVAIIDTGTDELADYVYVGDTGGQVWRIDVGGTSLTDWNVRKLASVGSDQKFLYPPDVVRTEQTDYNYSVLIGSGNREDPMDVSVSNAFYMFKDGDNIAAWPYTKTDLLNVETASNAIEQAITESTGKGWYLPFSKAGEKVIGSAVSAGGATYFYTNEPQGSTTDASGAITSCATGLGTSYEYIVNFETGGTVPNYDRVTTLTYGGLIPSPVIVVVEIEGIIYTGIMTDPDSIAAPPLGPTLGTRQRVFWYKQLDE